MSAEDNRYVPPVRSDGLRHWQVAGGIIVVDDAILLVENLRNGGARDWSTPGGVVDSCDWLRVGEGMILEIRSFYDSRPIRAVLSPSEQAGLDG